MLKILNSQSIKELDAQTILFESIPSIDLMERASAAFLEILLKEYPGSEPVIIFCGKGNNGGDGLAVARLLADKCRKAEVFIAETGQPASEDFQANLKRLPEPIPVKFIKTIEDFPILNGEELVVDALFGSGLSRPVIGLIAEMIDLINASDCRIVSIDLPSGLPPDGIYFSNGKTIQPDLVVSFHFPKLSFFLPENAPFIGRWTIADIGLHVESVERASTEFFLTESKDISPLFPSRNKFSHKGNFGHALLIAGSYGKTGAAILSAMACLRSGVGLLTAHIPKSAFQAFQGAVPEAMVIPSRGKKEVDSAVLIEPFSCVGIGPGLGKGENARKLLKRLLEESKAPVVMDADALNILSEEPQFLTRLPKNTILTPHPKEFERLAGKSNSSIEWLELARDFAKDKKVVLVLKGAYTAVIDQSGNVYFNATGNPGMARGGSGDALTGIILGLLGQGFSAIDAARSGVYIHGLAGDIACEKFGETGMMISDLISSLPDAYKQIVK